MNKLLSTVPQNVRVAHPHVEPREGAQGYNADDFPLTGGSCARVWPIINKDIY